MAKLPPIDVTASWAKDALHRGQRDRALAIIANAIASGRAGAETRSLAEYLATAGRGRQPFGAKHLWFDIGRDNEELQDRGVGYEDRLQLLGAKYMLAVRQVEAAIAEFATAMEEVRKESGD